MADSFDDGTRLLNLTSSPLFQLKKVWKWTTLNPVGYF
jgi:hypothetical protein